MSGRTGAAVLPLASRRHRSSFRFSLFASTTRTVTVVYTPRGAAEASRRATRGKKEERKGRRLGVGGRGERDEAGQRGQQGAARAPAFAPGGRGTGDARVGKGNGGARAGCGKNKTRGGGTDAAGAAELRGPVCPGRLGTASSPGRSVPVARVPPSACGERGPGAPSASLRRRRAGGGGASSASASSSSRAQVSRATIPMASPAARRASRARSRTRGSGEPETATRGA